MKYLLSLLITVGLALGACSQKEVPQTHYIVMEQAAIFKVHYPKPDTLVIDSVLYCGHEVNTFVFRPDSVFLVDSLKNSEKYELLAQLDRGVYLLGDGTNIPTVLQIHEFAETEKGPLRITVYFQRANYILRFSGHKNLTCKEL